MGNPVIDPFLYMGIITINCFMVQDLQVWINLVVIANFLIDLINWNLSATSNFQTIQKSIYFNSIRWIFFVQKVCKVNFTSHDRCDTWVQVRKISRNLCFKYLSKSKVIGQGKWDCYAWLNAMWKIDENLKCSVKSPCRNYR